MRSSMNFKMKIRMKFFSAFRAEVVLFTTPQISTIILVNIVNVSKHSLLARKSDSAQAANKRSNFLRHAMHCLHVVHKNGITRSFFSALVTLHDVAILAGVLYSMYLQMLIQQRGFIEALITTITNQSDSFVQQHVALEVTFMRKSSRTQRALCLC